ncbi:pyrroline-5-carboxylate reductase [Metabacillus litoralis]|uniref:pyrroline-5-carboxylate reductase n=1 Tax=Metabacillus litoralis TaxID=152268 RepID=UPI00203B5D38|nr:pyrroline-5-carboxylate reductase [Metabacillus litoralis]MCM3410624.1 pyrroline-5-carboxylate reductase [Metabacillus litoralis]
MKNSILFIGAGRMAEAIISGLYQKSDEQINYIYVSNRSNPERLTELAKKYKANAIHDIEMFIKRVDVIVLAMPPGEHKDILKRISPYITNQLIVTVAAGIGPAYLEANLPPNTPVGWIMPNTAATIGHSISLYTYGKFVTGKHKKQMEMLVNAIGASQYCTEQQIHDLTAVTGSAPAFVYLFVETLIEFTEKMGVSSEVAEKLVNEMVIGSAEMLKGNLSARELREQVTTPGGATAEGIKVLQHGQFTQLVQQAVIATNKKAKGEE